MVAAVRVASHMREEAAVESNARHSSVSAEELARKWRIGLGTAQNTLKVTTQFGLRHAVHPLRRRYRTDLMTMNLRRINTTLYTDTLISKVKSLRGMKVAQVYANDDMVSVHPMRSKADVDESLQHQGRE
jgi:hypothetical protein